MCSFIKNQWYIASYLDTDILLTYAGDDEFSVGTKNSPYWLHTDVLDDVVPVVMENIKHTTDPEEGKWYSISGDVGDTVVTVLCKCFIADGTETEKISDGDVVFGLGSSSGPKLITAELAKKKYTITEIAVNPLS
jgi:hypothetical protein